MYNTVYNSRFKYILSVQRSFIIIIFCKEYMYKWIRNPDAKRVGTGNGSHARVYWLKYSYVVFYDSRERGPEELYNPFLPRSGRPSDPRALEFLDFKKSFFITLHLHVSVYLFLLFLFFFVLAPSSYNIKIIDIFISEQRTFSRWVSLSLSLSLIIFMRHLSRRPNALGRRADYTDGRRNKHLTHQFI